MSEFAFSQRTDDTRQFRALQRCMKGIPKGRSFLYCVCTVILTTHVNVFGNSSPFVVDHDDLHNKLWPSSSHLTSTLRHHLWPHCLYVDLWPWNKMAVITSLGSVSQGLVYVMGLSSDFDYSLRRLAETSWSGDMPVLPPNRINAASSPSLIAR